MSREKCYSRNFMHLTSFLWTDMPSTQSTTMRQKEGISPTHALLLVILSKESRNIVKLLYGKHDLCSSSIALWQRYATDSLHVENVF